MTAITETDFGYTGQREYKSFGLMDYHARFYSPYLKHFCQPDTIIPGNGAMALNRYMYAKGNPIKYVDPSGHCVLLMTDYGESCYNEESSQFTPMFGNDPFIHRATREAAGLLMRGNENPQIGASSYDVISNSFPADIDYRDNVMKEINIISSLLWDDGSAVVTSQATIYAQVGGATVITAMFDNLVTGGLGAPNMSLFFNGANQVINNIKYSINKAYIHSKYSIENMMKNGKNTTMSTKNKLQVYELTTDTDALEVFESLVVPGTIKTIPKDYKFLSGDYIGGGTINYREVSGTYPYPPTIDFHKVPGYAEILKFKFFIE